MYVINGDSGNDSSDKLCLYAKHSYVQWLLILELINIFVWITPVRVHASAAQWSAMMYVSAYTASTVLDHDKTSNDESRNDLAKSNKNL